MPKTFEAIEMLRCAETNCDNAMKPQMGTVFVDLVKKQIQEALKLLEGEQEESDGS